jgi:hypothetical protein
MAAPRGKDLDWQAIENDYRTGLMTDRQIAAQYGTTHATIGRRARSEGWEQDLNARIMAKAQSELSKAELSIELSTNKRIADKQIVDANATALKDSLLEHRKDIRRNRTLANKLLAELEAQCDNPEDFRNLADLMDSDDESKLSELYRKVISLPSRIDGAKKLAETLRVTIALEREAFGMDKADPNSKPQISRVEYVVIE